MNGRVSHGADGGLVAMRLLPFLLPLTLLAPVRADDDPGPRLQQLLADRVAHQTTPGAVLLVQSPQVSWVGATGLADVGAKRAMVPTDHLRIASISKVFVAATVLKLCEEGALELDAPVNRYLPRVVLRRLANGDRATLRQLLSMTSGVPDYVDLPDFNDALDHNRHPQPYTPAEILAMVYDLPAEFEPGEDQGYSNTNYILVEMAVQSATGQPMAVAMRRLVLDPLGLTETWVEIAEPRPGGFHGLTVHGYKQGADVTTHNDALGRADGCVITTARDLQRFLDALLRTKTLLKPDSLAAMTAINPIENYGLGLDRAATTYGPAFGHSGGGAGFGCDARYLPDQDTFFVLLTNDNDMLLFDGLFEPSLKLALPGVKPVWRGAPYRLVARWGSDGPNDGEFSGPAGLAFDPAGNVYVAEYNNCRIQKLAPDGHFIRKWGSRGDGRGQFAGPSGVAVDAHGYVYVADNRNDRVQKFTPEGAFVRQWGGHGKGPGQFDAPCGLAVDPRGDVWVADSNNDRVEKFGADGVYIGQLGSSGDGDGQLDGPSGVAADAAGAVYVADDGNGRVEKFGPAGRYLAQWSGEDAGDGALASLAGITVGRDGNVYVADPKSMCLDEFSPDGALLARWCGYDAAPERFGHPETVGVDPHGRVYVGNSAANCIEVIAPL